MLLVIIYIIFISEVLSTSKTAGDSTSVAEDTQKEYTYAYGMVESRATYGHDKFLMGSSWFLFSLHKTVLMKNLS